MSKHAYLNTALPLAERVGDLMSQMTLDEKLGLLHTRQSAVPRLGIAEYFVGAECAHGLMVRRHFDQWPSGTTTIFPQPIGMSCTWDAGLMQRIGDVIGNEARIWYEKDDRRQWLTLWSPTIDMERDPRWGRNEEAYGEDPYLAGKLSAAFIRGIQGDDDFYIKAACAPKHFYGNNVEATRISGSTNISERVKREYYLRVFKYAFVEGKSMSLMTAYNEINGLPCIVNPEVQDIVKGEWGCEGFIVCDGGDLIQTVTEHKYCETLAEAIALAIKAGVDCFTERDHDQTVGAAAEALEKGFLTIEDVDRAVRNILNLRFRFGHFDPDEMCPFTAIKEDRLCCDEHSATALESYRKSVVLLKNDGVLPLDPAKCGKVLVLGDLAAKNMADWYSGKPPEAIAPLDAIKKILPESSVETVGLHDLCVIYNEDEGGWLRVDDEGTVNYDGDETTRTEFEEIDWGFTSVSYRNVKTGKYLNLLSEQTLGCTADHVWGWFTMELFYRDAVTGRFIPHGKKLADRFNDEQKQTIDGLLKGLRRETLNDGLAAAVEAAAKADTVIFMPGNHPLINGRECFDRPAITFPQRWTEILQRLHTVNPNIVLSLIAGYPHAFPEESKLARAVLYTSHGEQYLGTALAEVLFGKYNPAGRLSMTWYLSEDDLPDIEDYDIINSPRTYMYFDKPVQFPFGHGLSYSTFEYSDMSVAKAAGGYTATCTVRNTGQIAGDEVVQLYATLRGVPVKAPNLLLCGFDRVHFAAGETKAVSFFVPDEEVRLFDEAANAFSIIPEEITFSIGASSADLRLKEDIKL